MTFDELSPIAATSPTPGENEKEDNGLSSEADGEALERRLTGIAQADSSPRNFGTLRWVLMMTATYTTCFLYGLDNTIVADIQGAVVTAFNEVEKLSWLGSGFPLGGIATILAQGKFYGSFDFKYLYLGNITLFAVGSALCGAAPNMNALVIGRVLAGIGAAGMYLGTLGLISMFTTLKERSIYMALIIFAWGIGTILGPVIGGAFADSGATWRWAFYINLVIFGALTPIYILCIPNPRPQPNVTFVTKLLGLDWVGILLNCGIYVAWVIALQFSGTTWAWGDGRSITCFVITGVLVIVFGIQQYYCILTTPKTRLFPIAFLKRRTLMLLYMVTSCINGSISIVVYFIPVYFQFVHGDNGIDSAVRLLPFILTLVAVTGLNGFLLPKFPYYLPWFLISGALMTAGGAMLYTINLATSSSFIYGASALVGIGTGTVNAAYTVAASKVKPAEVNDGLSFINIAQIGGIMHTLALSGAVYQNVAANGLRSVFKNSGVNFSPSDIGSAVGGSKSVVFQTLTPEVKELAISAIVAAIQKVWAMLIAAGAFTVVCSMLMRWENLILKVQAGG